MIKKHIPNTLTCCNLISGCAATYFALFGELEMAFIFIIIGAVFDFFDGMSARLLGVSSPIGKELDSLADLITFGMAPSSMACYALNVVACPEYMYATYDFLPYVAFIMTAFAALRLAKFNLDSRQTSSFIGLPTPANALFWASLLVGGDELLWVSEYMVFAMLALIALSCYLMVAEIPMFALKFKHWGWRGNEIRYTFLLSCIPLLAIFRLGAFAIIVAWYVVLSIYSNKKTTTDDSIHL